MAVGFSPAVSGNITAAPLCVDCGGGGATNPAQDSDYGGECCLPGYVPGPCDPTKTAAPGDLPGVVRGNCPDTNCYPWSQGPQVME